jgi:signal transduction histidine kinase
MLQRIMRKFTDLVPAIQDDGDNNPGRIMNSLGYITALAGYLFTLLATQSLTLPSFLAFTAANGLWFFCFILLTNYGDDSTANQVHLTMLGLAVATFWADALIITGVALDWLLAIVTIVVFILVYPTRLAMITGGAIALGTMALVMVASIAGGRAPNQILQDQITLAPAFLYAFTFPFFMRQQRKQRERAEALVAELEVAQEQLRAHADQVEELAITRERNRMAREIHDTLGHYLTILAVQLETALKLEERNDPRLHDELVESRRAAAECLAEVRHSVNALRPTDLVRYTLSEALARLVREFESALPETTEIVLDADSDGDRLSPELRVTLYRCAQEALTNVRKHAHATKVLVRLRVDGGQAELTILDNGLHGMNGAEGTKTGGAPAPTSGFGLQGIRERIALVGGSVAAGPEQGAGWRVEVTMPVTSDDMTPGALAASGSARDEG